MKILINDYRSVIRVIFPVSYIHYQIFFFLSHNQYCELDHHLSTSLSLNTPVNKVQCHIFCLCQQATA